VAVESPTTRPDCSPVPDARADVWDEAFFPLATGEWSRRDRAATAVVGSLTKLFACPGLRFGYVIAEPDMIRELEARQPLWAVGALELALLPNCWPAPTWSAGPRRSGRS